MGNRVWLPLRALCFWVLLPAALRRGNSCGCPYNTGDVVGAKNVSPLRRITPGN
ncbi:MAG: hypothetical protein LBJ67_18160 [Planctomycetaceae bacterium]|nr:hypothetical protein [Planctomycetaceae bacterium]